jgi:hypothetical protein
VALHRVSREVSGKLDSILADPDGSFRFRFITDTSTVYLLSASWSGIEYFGDPLPGASLGGTTTLTLLVADTSSAGTAETGGRFLVLGSPGAGKDRRAVDLFVIRNRGDRTIVGAGGTSPTWSAPLPPGVTDARMGSAGSEVSGEAVRFEPGRISVIAPIAPGEKQLLLEYTIPASMGSLELDPVTPDTIQVVAEEPGIAVAGLERASDQVLDGRSFARWTGRGARKVTVTFPVPPTRDGALLPLVVAAIVVAVLGGVVATRLRRRGAAPAPVTSEALLTRIAALDAANAGRALAAGDQARYERDRAALKRALTEQLRRESQRGL